MCIYRENFYAVCYIGTMPRLVMTETWFFGIIHCISLDEINILVSKFRISATLLSSIGRVPQRPNVLNRKTYSQ